MSPRTLKTLAVVYLVKSLLVGIAWLAVPDLPHKAWDRVRHTLGIAMAQAAGRGEAREITP